MNQKRNGEGRRRLYGPIHTLNLSVIYSLSAPPGNDDDDVYKVYDDVFESLLLLLLILTLRLLSSR